MPSPRKNPPKLSPRHDDVVMMTPAQVQECLQISSNALYALLDSGAIASYKIGPFSRRIPKSAVVAFLARVSEAKPTK